MSPSPGVGQSELPIHLPTDRARAPSAVHSVAFHPSGEFYGGKEEVTRRLAADGSDFPKAWCGTHRSLEERFEEGDGGQSQCVSQTCDAADAHTSARSSVPYGAA